jgi:fatty-acyl-CoA synthase
MKQYTQDWIGKWAVYSPEKVALAEQGSERRMTYGQLNRLGNRLANYFQTEMGLGKGDRIAVLADNCLEYIVLFSAAQKAGFTLVPLNYRFTGKEIDYLLANADPSLVIGEEKYQHLLDAAPAYKSIPHRWSLEELRDFCDPAEERPDDDHFEVVPVDENDPIFILFTAGTTGFPKGALYTHKMLFWNSINTAMSLIINTESRTVNCMPPFHTGGWNVLTTPLLHHGGFIYLMKKFDPAEVLRLLTEEKVTIFMGVPTMLKMMADEPAFEKSDFSQLYYIIVGGEPMPIPLIEIWHEKGVPIRQGYGMTEVGPNLTSLHQNDAVRKKGSIGRPNYYVEIKIVDEKGKEMKANVAGELLLKGPMVTPGYWKNEEATRKTIVEGWFHTGDRVRQDEEGYLFVVDRIKNMYISGGENVYPAEVERALVAHPEVSEVAVIGVPDERWGEVGHAFVVPVKGAELTAETLKQYSLDHLAKFKIPKHYTFLEALPKNDAGKINKRALQEKS